MQNFYISVLQLLAELGRITNADIMELKEIWKEATPRIFMMAKEEGSRSLITLIAHLDGDDLSDGKRTG